MNVLGICGSLRRDSYNRSLLRAAAERAPAGMTIHPDDRLSAIPLFNEDLEHDTPAAVRDLRRAVAAADGLLIATPEYNQSIPGVLKNAIDWLSRPAPEEVLVGKPVAVIGASGGRWGTRLAQNALRQALFATESVPLPSPALFVREAQNAFDADGGLIDIAIGQSLDALLVEFARWIEITHRHRP
ncbi:NADPH-dependent FMN reductase [Steroidobacter cummioxidans]|uniref:NADPH-dependent FMN reductase n=1 Tax=Steroidobacter cummioxidans TaxID=1803913 RepID=UPI000E311C06|nr:NADPH-dependent FMN reductase [Steroidobacter cummioxidans]